MIIVKVNGGLGNQMFQYAFYRSLMKEYSNVKLDIHLFNKHQFHHGYELEKVFHNTKADYAEDAEIDKLGDFKIDFFSKVRRKLIGSKKTYYFEKKYNYKKDISNKANNMYFDGYWQSEKYFIDIANIIRYEFTFLPIDDSNNMLMADEISQTESVSIHIRRGDYINHPLYSNICTLDYYQKAIKIMNKKINNPVFYIFSDDINWCKNNLQDLTEVRYIDWNKGDSSFRDMQLMSLCKHNIIANSTFSWWGAWLNTNNNKIVIAPDKILNGDNDMIDLIPEQWIKIKIEKR